MIWIVEKIYAMKFQRLVMVSLDNTKIHHVELWEIFGETFYII
jgi:hypothetical protein